MTKFNRLAFYRKWSLTIKIIPAVAIILAIKLVIHYLGLDTIAPNPLLPSLVAATVFLMGFLISGVLADYKESEKLPGELAANIETIADEAAAIYKSKKAAPARDLLDHLQGFSKLLNRWFQQQERTTTLLTKIQEFSDYYTALEPYSQPTFISRLKQEQHNIRKILLRIHTIRETSFIPSGYAIAEGIAILLLIAILVTKLDPFYESMFFLIPITYLFVYMIALIKDLDNPFEYKNKGGVGGEVSLKEIQDLEQRLKDRTRQLDAIK